MSRRLLVRILAAAGLCATAALILAGCNESSFTVDTPPPAGLTPATACIVNTENDVIVGGPDAKPGCDEVVMETATSNPLVFDEIMIGRGGTLTVVHGDGDQAQAQRAATRDSIPLEPLFRPVREFCVMDGGVLQIGTESQPVSGTKVVLGFRGDRHSSSTNNMCPDFKKGIEVMAGGTLRMYGVKGVPARGGVSWTTLARPAGTQVPGAKVATTGTKTLVLTDDVTKGPDPWGYGDWIVIATTSYNPFESEFVRIDTVTSNPQGGSTVTLLQPLKYYHFGSLPPSPASETCPDPFDPAKTQPAFLCDGADRNWGVDERAAVGLISRNIELFSVVPDVADSLHWGGEITIHPGFKEVSIQGVRLSKFGKDQTGSYPIHFHMVGTVGEAPNPAGQRVLIDADSIDHSYNHCVTIHSTSNLTISNLVCARIVGHIFYQELMRGPVPPPPDDTGGDDPGGNNPAADSDIIFKHNLGIGAMSHSFDIYPATVNGVTLSRQKLIDTYWWAGDYMTNAECKDYFTCNRYDGFNIPDTDNPMQATHGSCYKPSENGTGLWIGGTPPPCKGELKYYLEPASGFWIQNPDTVLVDNAIAGCQGDGVAYWWVPPPGLILVNGKQIDLRLSPLGEVSGDRASACYHAYFAEGETGVISGQLSPIKNGENELALNAPNIITHFDNLTATHTRWRALWLRGTAAWYVVSNGHFADNNRGATLLTSGGVDGNAPGIWQMIRDSVFVGVSENNVGRWGPCPKINMLGPNTGFEFGCIDYSHPPIGTFAHSGELNGKGYPGPDRNSYGYQIYDGPPLIFHNRFVNYNYNTDPNSAASCSKPGNLDPVRCAFSIQLTYADREALGTWETSNSTPYSHYEGDAALGWFPANQNAYPTATTTRELMWVNTNFRHQIFTEHVAIDSTFGDGDKNTAIIDEDGTLSGFGVKLAANAATDAKPVHAFSLNNLPFNSTSNSVDECFSRGAQDQAKQGRDSSLMSPAAMGTLEFASLYPWKPGDPNGNVWPGGTTTHWQEMTFTRTDQVPGQNGPFHPSMTLNSRAGQGYWEPKLSHGYAYAVTVAPATANFIPPDQNTGKAGIYKWIDVGLADVVDPNISAQHPFFILLGIDYASVDESGQVRIPNGNFTIKRGYKAYFGGVFYTGETFPGGKHNDLFDYFTLWPNCHGLDGHRSNAPVPNIPKGNGPGCPAGDSGLPAVMTLSAAASFDGLTDANGKPIIDKYYYNPATGYLWLYIVQEEPNAVGPSPIGSCDKDFDGGTPDPACPDWENGESYYVCPKNGCIIYTIAMNDSNYQPGPSPSWAVLPPQHLPPAPADQNKLVLHGTDTVVERRIKFDKQDVPYHVSTNGPNCQTTEPPIPGP
ncbi:MAG: G8 domain-containing protein [Gammaproteobacteria bacterium]|nr:G8 domain-containing protein [Gammaproteobacteria bacterium]